MNYDNIKERGQEIIRIIVKRNNFVRMILFFDFEMTKPIKTKHFLTVSYLIDRW